MTNLLQYNPVNCCTSTLALVSSLALKMPVFCSYIVSHLDSNTLLAGDSIAIQLDDEPSNWFKSHTSHSMCIEMLENNYLPLISHSTIYSILHIIMVPPPTHNGLTAY